MKWFIFALLWCMALSTSAGEWCRVGPEYVIRRRVISVEVLTGPQQYPFVTPGVWIYYPNGYGYPCHYRPQYDYGMPRPYVPMGWPSHSNDFYQPW
ncbi:MAG: hypothetical protein KGL39_54655 [Patescibacteria group bacterium]|nr:hypothetical protein [Patescibacteria group bacterium]